MSVPPFSLSEAEFRELVVVTEALFDEADRCAGAGFWRAAVLLLGEGVEAGLVATLACFEPELRAQGAWRSKGAPTTWTLGQALQVARAAGWLPARATATSEDDLFAPLRGEIGDAVGFLLSVRNMVSHPGAHVRAEVRPDLADPDHMRPTYEVLRGVASQVFEQLRLALETASADPAGYAGGE
jgi:hypothetical protein